MLHAQQMSNKLVYNSVHQCLDTFLNIIILREQLVSF